MSTLSAKVRGALLQAHQNLKQRMIAALPPTITPLDVYNVVISERDREILREAKKLGARTSSYHSNMTIQHNNQEIIIDLEDCGLVPSAIIARNHRVNPEWSFTAELCSWADQVIEIHHKFKRGEHVLELLEERCANIKQMRYFLPGIATLVTIGGNRELGQELTTSPIVRNAPPLPFGARQAIADYNSLIAQATLLPSTRVRDTINVKYIKEAPQPWTNVTPTSATDD